MTYYLCYTDFVSYNKLLEIKLSSLIRFIAKSSQFHVTYSTSTKLLFWINVHKITFENDSQR